MPAICGTGSESRRSGVHPPIREETGRDIGESMLQVYEVEPESSKDDDLVRAHCHFPARGRREIARMLEGSARSLTWGPRETKDDAFVYSKVG